MFCYSSKSTHSAPDVVSGRVVRAQLLQVDPPQGCQLGAVIEVKVQGARPRRVVPRAAGPGLVRVPAVPERTAAQGIVCSMVPQTTSGRRQISVITGFLNYCWTSTGQRNKQERLAAAGPAASAHALCAGSHLRTRVSLSISAIVCRMKLAEWCTLGAVSLQPNSVAGTESRLGTPRPLQVLMVPSPQALSAAPVCKRQSAHWSAPVIMIGRLYLVVIWSMYLQHGSAECHPGAECRTPSSRWLQAPGGSASMAGARGRTVGKRKRCRASSSAPPASQSAAQRACPSCSAHAGCRGRLRRERARDRLHAP